MKTAEEMREKTRKRIERFRNKQIEAGFRNQSYMISKKDIEFIEKLKKEKGFSNKNETIAFILQISREALHETKKEVKLYQIGVESFSEKELKEMPLKELVLKVSVMDMTLERKSKMLNGFGIKTPSGLEFNSSRFADLLRRFKKRS